VQTQGKRHFNSTCKATLRNKSSLFKHTLPAASRCYLDAVRAANQALLKLTYDNITTGLLGEGFNVLDEVKNKQGLTCACPPTESLHELNTNQFNKHFAIR